MPISRTLNQDFFKEWSSDMAYVLGYFAADGCMIQNMRGGYYIEFTSTDRILIEHVQKVTGSSQRIAIRERGGNTKTAYRLQIGSKKWYLDLIELGFTQHKSHTLEFPDVPLKYLGHFVRGYFDGDGCVYLGSHFAKDRSVQRVIFQTQFISGSEPFLRKLWTHLKEGGVVGGHVYKRKSGASNLVLSWKDSLALYQLMYNTSQVPGLFLPRKRQKFERAIALLGLE